MAFGVDCSQRFGMLSAQDAPRQQQIGAPTILGDLGNAAKLTRRSYRFSALVAVVTLLSDVFAALESR